MSKVIPLWSSLLCLVGLGIVGGSGYIYINGLANTPDEVQYSPSISDKDVLEIAPIVYHDILRTEGYVDITLSRSPFVMDRSAFSKFDPVEQPPIPAAPEYDPEFVGSLGRGDDMRILVIWGPNQPAASHAIGDQTPWGVLVSASSTKLVFQDEAERRVLDLF